MLHYGRLSQTAVIKKSYKTEGSEKTRKVRGKFMKTSNARKNDKKRRERRRSENTQLSALTICKLNTPAPQCSSPSLYT